MQWDWDVMILLQNNNSNPVNFYNYEISNQNI